MIKNNKKITFTCPFCYSENDNFFKIKKNKTLEKILTSNGYVCKSCKIRIPETLIINFINEYNYRFL